MNVMKFTTALVLTAALVQIIVAGAASAQGGKSAYDFVAPPSAKLNRMFWVDKATGQVGACDYQSIEGETIGRTRCYEGGEGAGATAAGNYALRATNKSGEVSVMRVNHMTGEISFCWVKLKKVLCTAPAK